jgi:uncharacterized protein with PQ loop repeat
MTKLANKIHLKYFEKHRQDPVSVARVDNTMMIIGFLSPLATFIQAITIVVQKSAGSMSIVSWLIYLIVNISWFLYGFLHKSKPLVVVDSLSIMVTILVIAEFFVFK